MRTTIRTILSVLALGLFCSAATVTLTGCAGTESRKSTGEYIDDAAITTKVKAKLAEDPVVSALQVNVDTFKGRVRLSGSVDSIEQKERAAKLAKRVNGVRDVTNDLVVKVP